MLVSTLIEKIAQALDKYSRPWSIQVRLLHLAEEVGELIDVILQYEKEKEGKQSKEDISKALGDVMLDITAIYHHYGLDFTKSCLKGIKDLSKSGCKKDERRSNSDKTRCL